MAARKYDWVELKKQWLVSNDRVLRDFCKRIGLPDPRHNSFIADKLNGWKEEKERVRALAIEEFGKQTAGEWLSDTKEIRIQHAKQAAEVITKAMEYLTDRASKIRSVDEARKLLETGVKIQRDALGMSEKSHVDQNVTNLTIYESKFGDLIDNQDEQGLTRLITSIRKLKRARTAVSGESGSGETGQLISETT